MIRYGLTIWEGRPSYASHSQPCEQALQDQYGNGAVMVYAELGKVKRVHKPVGYL